MGTELAVLPYPVLQFLIDGINKCVGQGMWPLSFAPSHMALLPKPAGGHRTVAKTPVLYRMWGVSRRSVIKEWEHDHMLEVDGAAPGKSALDAALLRLLQAEVAVLNKKSFVGV